MISTAVILCTDFTFDVWWAAPPMLHRQSPCLATTHESSKWIKDDRAIHVVRSVFVRPNTAERQFYHPYPRASWARWQISGVLQVFVGVLAWLAFLWIALTDVISANHCCLAVVVFTEKKKKERKKKTVWSPSKRACRNKALNMVNTGSHFDIWIEPWREDACRRTNPSWQLGNFKLGHRSKQPIKAPICNCSVLFLLFLHCLCACSDSLNQKWFVIFK